MTSNNLSLIPDPEQAREARLVTAEKLSAIANDLEATPELLHKFAAVLDLASKDSFTGAQRPEHAARCAALADDLKRIVHDLRELALDLLPKRANNGHGGDHAA